MVQKYEVNSVKYNFIMNSIMTISSIVFPLITFPYISRVLGPAGTGNVYFANSFVTYFSIIAQLGIPTYGIRACARVRDDPDELNQTFQEIFIINCITTCISILLFMITLFNVTKLKNDKGIFLVVGCSMLFNTIGIEWLYKGLEQYSHITIRFVSAKIVAFILMFIFVTKEDDSLAYCAISVFAGGASFIYNFVHARKVIHLNKCNHYSLRRHLKPILIFCGMSCAATIATNFDNVMLGFMKNDIIVGYYNAAVKIKTILISVLTSLGTVLLPRSSYYIENEQYDKFMGLTGKALSILVLGAVPLVIFFMIYASESILFLSGDQFIESVSPMIVIMPSVLFVSMSNLIGMQMFVPVGKEMIVFKAQLVGTIVNICINSCLIPGLSTIGASIGTVVSEVIIWLILYLCTRHRFGKIYEDFEVKPVFLTILVFTLSCFLLKSLNLIPSVKLIVSFVISFIVYLVTLYIFNVKIIRDLSAKLVSKYYHRRT